MHHGLWQTRPQITRMGYSMIRVLIIDDESPARSGLRALLTRELDIEVVGECSDGHEAAEKIETLQPDAVFLDVQMPRLTGIELLQSGTLTRRPYAIITTAHDDYALQAFDVQAMDYLLKPFDEARFRAALLRLRRHLDLQQRADGKVDVGSLLQRLAPEAAKAPPRTVSDRVPVKIGRRVRFLSLQHIRYITADGNYVNMHMTTGEVIHTSERISQMEEKLAPHHFLRIHRSIILNIDQIREAHSMGSYYEFIMTDGGKLGSGLTYKKNIQSLLNIWRKTRDNRLN